jgi:hypothetical protein
MAERAFKETIKVTADRIVDAVKKAVHEGNVRRVVIKQDGRIIAEFPLTVGVVGAVLAPMLAAIGAIAAVASDCTVEIERVVDDRTTPKQGAA